MVAIDNIVNINITQSASTVPTVSTTIPLLVGTTNPGWPEGDYVHAFGSASDLLSDGFTTTSPEYIHALALTAQKVVPNDFLVARRTGDAVAGKAQIDRISVNDVQGQHVYRFTVGAQVYSYTSQPTDSAALILQGLRAAVAADTNAVVIPTLSTNNTFLILTGKAEGQEIAFASVDAALTLENQQEAELAQADELTAEDLNAIQAQDDSWYGLVLIGASDDEIEAAATWVQSRRKRLFANSVTAGIEKPTDTDNLAVRLADAGFDRTVLTHALEGDATGLISAWVGYNLPQTPGTNNWAFNSLAGQRPDKFTTAATLAMIGNPVAGTSGRGVNIYTNVGGVNITQMGTNIDGSFVDIGIGVDWLFFNLQSSVYQALVGSSKIAMTDAGVAILKAAVRNVLDQGVANTLIDGTQDITITAAKVSSLPKAQRAARRAPTINFSCVLQGCVNAVLINGAVSV